MRVTFFISVATLITSVAARAVNISNTWMLPEEGFPVFYRYFRDRISWNEADAVCQFHHANLVTVDTTSQYDAIRAYLKELDIASNVWIGLSRSGEKPNFTWRDFRDLSAADHWQEAIPAGNDPLCAAMDAAADFRWHALSCGGPEVASFICELPVPSWAMGLRGCLITELPSLTVLFIPEQSAVELTSDCGLDGTKRVVCKGNQDRDELMQLLACTDLQDEGKSQAQPPSTFQPIAIEAHASSILNTKLNQVDIGSSRTTNIGMDTNAVTASAARRSASESAIMISATLGTPTAVSNANTLHSADVGTTKPWLWTSNTIDTGDYGAATRHRRGTEDATSQTLSAITTSPKPALRSSVTTSVPETSESSSIKPTSAMPGEKEDLALDTVTTSPGKLTTLHHNHIETEVNESSIVGRTPEPEEFASAINQGQLFSIIEDGALFDIIELNTTDENKTMAPDVKLTTTAASTSISAEYTTVIYQKEPTERVDAMSHKTAPVAATTATIRPPMVQGAPEEVPSFPIMANVKLNRTFRKKVPETDANGFRKADLYVNLDVDNDIKISTPLANDPGDGSGADKSHTKLTSSGKEIKNGTLAMVAHVAGVVEEVLEKMKKSIDRKNELAQQFVEIRFADSNATNSTLFVTTRRANDKNVENISKTMLIAFKPAKFGSAAEKAGKAAKAVHKYPIVTETSSTFDSQSNLSDAQIVAASSTENAETKAYPSSTSLPTLPTTTFGRDEDQKHVHVESEQMKELQHEEDVTKVSSNGPQAKETTAKSADFESEPTLKPNRQRLLTRSNRRSFYPYFFSRVLG